MPRGPAIEDFAAKLRLAVSRANLSRAELARRVGVDKSVVARWLSGGLRPGDQRLAALTTALAARIDGFGRADWDRPLRALATRFGTAGDPSPRGPEAASVMTHADRYAGLWVLLFPWRPPMADGTGRLMCLALELVGAEDGVTALLGDGPEGFWTGGGSVRVLDGTLWVTLERWPHHDALAMIAFWHVDAGLPAVLDGVGLTRVGTPVRTPASTRVMGFRVGEALEDRAAAEARWRRAAALVGGLERGAGVDSLLPASFVKLFWSGPLALTSAGLCVPPEVSQAGTERVVQLVDPPDSPRRLALQALRDIIAPALQG